MKWMVTGAAGFIGSHLCEQLLNAGADIVGLDAFIPYYPRAVKDNNQAGLLAHPRYHFSWVDLRQDPLEKLLADVEVVFHLAAMPGLTQSWASFDDYWTCNVQATHRLLEAIRRAAPRLRRLIYASTSSVYGQFASGDENLPMKPISPYGVTKLAAENLCRAYAQAYGVPLVVLRYFSVYGPRQRPDMGYYRFIQSALGAEPVVVYGDGQQVRGNTFVSDCVAATIAAVEAPLGETYNVGGGEAASVWDILHYLEKLAGRPLVVQREPARPGDQRYTFADTTRIRHHLGWEPRTSLEDGLARQWEWQQRSSRPKILSPFSREQETRMGQPRRMPKTKPNGKETRSPTGSPARPLRIALYSPGMVGIGHMRRNLLIAQTLADSPLRAVILMIAEAREANVLAMPPGGDCLTLPALCKDPDGACRPRYLEISLQALVRLRVKAIAAALETFKPDVLIVDHLPRGALRELDSTLKDLRAYGNTRCVLGLRDVLEDPAIVHREWRKAGNEAAIRDYYDAVWVYGDPMVYDPVREYHLSREVEAKMRYTGLLDFSRRPQFDKVERGEVVAALPAPPSRLMLCTVGGGHDGAHLAEAFAHAELPADATGVILTGPFMPAEVRQRLHRRAADNPRLRVLEFIADPDLLLRRADRIIAMGGYNTIYEVLSFEKHALIVPRSRPRHEQRIRAERLRGLGLLDVLAPEQVSPAALTEWLARDLGAPRRVRDVLDFDGTIRLPQLLQEVLTAKATPAPHTLPMRSLKYAAR